MCLEVAKWLSCRSTWQVTFHEPKLGLNLRRVDGVGAVVDSKTNPAVAAPATPRAESGSRPLVIDTGAAGQEVAPFVGDVVVSVGGEACDGDHTKVRRQPALYAIWDQLPGGLKQLGPTLQRLFDRRGLT